MSPKDKEINEKLREVKDPEFSFSIVERNLVDEINVKRRQGENTISLDHAILSITLCLTNW